MVMNKAHTKLLFILSNAIKDARDAAAPTSNAIAKETANQYGFDILKKSIT
jgi:prephenate dehydratase